MRFGVWEAFGFHRLKKDDSAGAVYFLTDYTEDTDDSAGAVFSRRRHRIHRNKKLRFFRRRDRMTQKKKLRFLQSESLIVFR